MLLSDTEIDKHAIIENGVPFLLGKVKWNDILSYGFSSAGYDVRLGANFWKQDSWVRHNHLIEINQQKIDGHFQHYWAPMKSVVIIEPGSFVLAHTFEILHIPVSVCGVVRDKSTLARLGLAVQNTVLEPGWHGSVTLEISNHNKAAIKIESGMPIAQIQFEVIQGGVARPYQGRYQYQKADVVPPKAYGDDK